MNRYILAAAALLAAALATPAAFAQITIDQNKALAGNVTPGDTPGFPITISQPGSYKLTGNLTVPASTTGIVITADDVTLDLNGFSLSGPVSCEQDSGLVVQCTQAYDEFKPGIDTRNTSRATVRNGTVKGFPGAGVLAGGAGLYEHLRVAHNGGQGFLSTSSQRVNTVAHSTFDTNRIHGLYMSVGHVLHSQAIGNTSGFTGGTGLLITDSQAVHNRQGVYQVRLRGTSLQYNQSSRANVVSLGGNVDGSTPF